MLLLLSLSVEVHVILDKSGTQMACSGLEADTYGRLPAWISLDRCAVRRRITDYDDNRWSEQCRPAAAKQY